MKLRWCCSSYRIRDIRWRWNWLHKIKWIIVLMIEVTYCCFFHCCRFFLLTTNNVSRHLFLKAFIFCLVSEKLFFTPFRISVFLISELRVTSFELLFIAGVTSYFLYTSYELLYIARVTSYFLYTSYELLFIARVTSYFLHTSYELLLIARVTS